MAFWRRIPLRLIMALLTPIIAAVVIGVWNQSADPSTPRAEKGAHAPTLDTLAPADPVSTRPKEIPAHILARGYLSFPFMAYETFGPGRIVLAAPAADGNVAVLVAEFRDRNLAPVARIGEPMGTLLDVTRGSLLNNGETQAVVTTEKGFLTLLGAERYAKQEETGLERIFVGDWDNDGLSEVAFLHRQEDARIVTLLRYGSDGRGVPLGSFPAPDFPTWSAVLDRPGKQSLLVGAERGEESLQVAFYSLDPIGGIQVTARYPIHTDNVQDIASLAAGDVTGRPTLAVSFSAAPSYMELFDTAAEGIPSRGRITFPDSDIYLVLAGTFTGGARSELLAITPLGRWILYGLG